MFVWGQLWWLKSALQLPGGQILDTCAQQAVPSEKDLAKLPLSHSTGNMVFRLCCFYHVELNLVQSVSWELCLGWKAYGCIAHCQQIQN